MRPALRHGLVVAVLMLVSVACGETIEEPASEGGDRQPIFSDIVESNYPEEYLAAIGDAISCLREHGIEVVGLEDNMGLLRPQVAEGINIERIPEWQECALTFLMEAEERHLREVMPSPDEQLQDFKEVALCLQSRGHRVEVPETLREVDRWLLEVPESEFDTCWDARSGSG